MRIGIGDHGATPIVRKLRLEKAQLAKKEIGSSTLQVFTIGHSMLSYESFFALLKLHGVNAIADVRTSPFSRHFPHFNKENLQRELGGDRVKYVFLGQELGGRPKSKQFFCEGVADYERMARTEEFACGLDRVVEGAKSYRIALMCSERNPLDCHRCLLVGRALHEQGVKVQHILGNGHLLDQGQIEAQLLDMAGKADVDLFEAPSKRLAAAYRNRAQKVAFSGSQFVPKNVDAGAKKVG
ncbi:DUF488 domain-containing protein [Mesorhizobium sp.]|uniref:DUF488 domain-containing protein n=1 Tax=Mesorhizobium sp. TaxID=1871066 RepID=UPI000FE6E0E6|nr:DUF488 domain-containing protein [Mesorhizobium sp.]RWI66025.1 MAG: DUF488 domain-containing protein [Mesorhizobium sp.]